MDLSATADLARHLSLTRQTATARARLDDAAAELATGRIARPLNELGASAGDYARIERRLAALPTDRGIIAETRADIAAADDALATLDDLADRLGPSLLGLSSLVGEPAISSGAEEGRRGLAQAVSALSATVAGRSLFAGTGTAGPALADAQAMLSAIAAEIDAAGATDAPAAVAVIEAWFAPGGGFETTAYLGTGIDRVTPALPAGETADPPPRADDDRFRGLLSGLAKAALSDHAALAGNPAARGELLRDAGLSLHSGRAGVLSARADLGVTMSALDRAETAARTEENRLRDSREDLIGVDPFEVSVRLRDAESRLESIYAITARLARLSLTAFLK